MHYVHSTRPKSEHCNYRTKIMNHKIVGIEMDELKTRTLEKLAYYA